MPNEGAIGRLVGALLLEQNDEWALQPARYMTLETMAPMSDTPLVSLPAVEIDGRPTFSVGRSVVIRSDTVHGTAPLRNLDMVEEAVLKALPKA